MIQKSGISIFLIVAILTNLFATDYFISFNFVVKDYQLKVEHFNCSKAMMQQDLKKKYLFSIFSSSKKITKVCNQYKNYIIEQLINSNIIAYSNDSLHKTRTKLSYPPKRFDIIINNGKIDFYLKE